MVLPLLASCGESCERYAAIGELPKEDDDEGDDGEEPESIPFDDKPTSEVFRAAEEKANKVEWDDRGLIDTGGILLADGLMPMLVEMKAGTTVQVEVYHLGSEETPPKMVFHWWVKSDDGWKAEEHEVPCEKAECEWKKPLPVEHDGVYVVALSSDVDTQVQLKLRDVTEPAEGEEGDGADEGAGAGKKKKGKKKKKKKGKKK